MVLFFSNAKIQFFPKSRIKIGHDYGSLFVDFPIDIIKTGRGQRSIFKIKLYLQRYDGKYELLFDWNKTPMTINDNVSMGLDLRFFQEPDMEKFNNFYPIYNKLKTKIIERYKTDGWANKAYFADKGDPQVEELKKYVQSLVKDLIPSKYRFLILALENSEENNPLWKASYTFELSKEQRKIVIDEQMISYDSVDEFNPKYQQYYATSFIEKLTDDEEKKLFNSYKQYITKKR